MVSSSPESIVGFEIPGQGGRGRQSPGQTVRDLVSKIKGDEGGGWLLRNTTRLTSGLHMFMCTHISMHTHMHIHTRKRNREKRKMTDCLIDTKVVY